MSKSVRPIALIILDGWGVRKENKDNAIASAKTTNISSLLDNYPNTLLNASGEYVGLPNGQMGNSEVGHLTMGAGRVVLQDLARISKYIDSNNLLSNQVLLDAIEVSTSKNSKIHLLGLVSDGGVHSLDSHLHGLLKTISMKKPNKVFVHAFLDGRDTPPKSAKQYLENLEQICKSTNSKIASISGRFYAMDRDKRWERTQVVYELLTEGKSKYNSNDSISALLAAYERDETDEFVYPTLIKENIPNLHDNTLIEDDDVVIFFNFRTDRARQLTQCFIDPNFNEFKISKKPKLSQIISMTEYSPEFKIPVLFPKVQLKNVFGKYLEDKGKTQLRIAETEKYAHVTFFFNGGREKPFENEDRVLIPSPKVQTYDLKPSMSAIEITEKLVSEIKSNKYDAIICNFANADMLGHTGKFTPTVQAIEVLDQCIGKIVEALQDVKGEAIITSDHGNAEIMFDSKTSQPHTAHTTELVPFIYVGKRAKIKNEVGTLADVSPSLLHLMGLKIPDEMTGHSLFEKIS